MSFLIPSTDLSTATSPKFAKALVVIGGLGIVALAVPLITLVLKGVFGILAIGGGMLFGLGCIKALPLISMKFSNWLLKMARYEARQNPVETKMNNYKADKDAADRLEVECKTINDTAEAYRTDVNQFVKEYPADAQSFIDELAGLCELRDLHYATLADMRENLKLAWKDIERARAIWAMTQATDRAGKIAGRLTQKDATRQIMESEANRSIEEGRARSRAALDHLRRVQAAGKPLAQLPAPAKPEVLIPDASGVYATSPVPVQRKVG